MDEIEASLASGMSRKTLRGKLAQFGIDMSLSTLNSILYRYRKKHNRAKKEMSIEQGEIPAGKVGRE